MATQADRDHAAHRLHGILKRVKDPPIINISVTPEYVTFDWLVLPQGGLPVRPRVHIWFHALERIEFHEPTDTIRLRVKTHRYPYQMRFATNRDMHAFIDLMLSFHGQTEQGNRHVPVTHWP